MAIPKLLHFTWKTTVLPRLMQDYYDKWLRLHPDWEVRLWTDETMRSFVAEAYPDFLAVYDGYPKMIQRADAFRYLVLGRLGGIYADLDVEPLQAVTPLLGLECFVGVEPLEHIGPDRVHQGVPLLFSNAFMGSVPGHAMWREVIRTLPGLIGQETFYATGPSMVTAVALRLTGLDRPALLLPEVWSPLLSTGVRGKSDGRLKPMLERLGRVVAADSGALVSHKWMTTWMPWHKRGNRFAGLLQIPTQVKWWWRRQRHRHLAAISIADPLVPYLDQVLPEVADRPRVHVAVRLGGGAMSPELAAAVEALDYPRERLSVRHYPDARPNAVLEAVPEDAEKLLLVDGAVRAFPPDALLCMLAAGRPVVAANCVDAEGRNADPALFRYGKGAPFKVLYRDGGLSGLVRRDPAFRSYLGEQRVFNKLPLDGAGESFVLIDRAVIAARVRFAETPYKLHLGGEAFAIMARDKGFEVAGLPGLEVVRA